MHRSFQQPKPKPRKAYLPHGVWAIGRAAKGASVAYLRENLPLRLGPCLAIELTCTQIAQRRLSTLHVHGQSGRIRFGAERQKSPRRFSFIDSSYYEYSHLECTQPPPTDRTRGMLLQQALARSHHAVPRGTYLARACGRAHPRRCTHCSRPKAPLCAAESAALCGRTPARRHRHTAPHRGSAWWWKGRSGDALRAA